MEIRNYGEVVLCKNIKFEDKKIDLEEGHPGIVLLPTNENDDYAFCLYMTSDAKRANREKDKYIKFKGKSVKTSYVNIQQIVKIINNKGSQLGSLEDSNFLELLQEFYNYQMSLENVNEEFLKIKNKVEVLIYLSKLNETYNIKEKITSTQLEKYSSISDNKKLRMIYGTELIMKEQHNNGKIKGRIFTNEKDRKHYEKLVEIYYKVRNINFDKINLEDPNNEVRKVYMDLRQKNYLMNINTLFDNTADLLDILDNDKQKYSLLKKFIKLEMIKGRKKSRAKIEKSKNKKKEKKKRRVSEKIEIANKREAKLKEIYGDFDI